LAVSPGGAYVALDNPFFPVASDGRPDIAAHVWLGHETVDDIDAGLPANVDDSADFLFVMAL
jgi:hypothetical protein